MITPLVATADLAEWLVRYLLEADQCKYLTWDMIENYAALRARIAREDAFLEAGRPDLIAYSPAARVLP